MYHVISLFYHNVHFSYDKDSMAAGGTRVNYAEFAGYFRRVAAASLAAEKEEAPTTGLFLVGWMGGLSWVGCQITDVLISLQPPQGVSVARNA